MSSASDFIKDTKQLRSAFNKAAEDYDAVALLQRTICDRLLESFEHLKIQPKRILDLGSGTGYGASQIKHIFKKATIVQMDIAEKMLARSIRRSRFQFARPKAVCADAIQIPLSDNSIDLVFSNLMLQWCNDLDRVFSEIKRVLTPNGVFLFSNFGPDSLKELRQSWQQADQSVHVNAFVDMHDVGDALLRNGLDSPVLSVEHIVLTYHECNQLMRDLKSIGAHNINQGRRRTLTGKERMNKMTLAYESFRRNGLLPATYEIIYGHAWCPTNKLSVRQDEHTQEVSLQQMQQALKNQGRKI